MSIWLKIGLVSALIAILVGWHLIDKKTAVKAAIQATEVSMNIEYQKKLDAAKESARMKEKQMQEDHAKRLAERDEKIKYINTKLNSTISSLQYYKKCESARNNPSDTSAYIACPGRELSREDAEFLAREAALADTVVEERNYYYEQYESARKRLGTN